MMAPLLLVNIAGSMPFQLEQVVSSFRFHLRHLRAEDLGTQVITDHDIMRNSGGDYLSPDTLVAEGVSLWPSSLQLWVPFTVFFLLMLGVGWIPETLLKIPGLYSVSLGELSLALAVLLNWRAVFGRLAQPRSRTALDILLLVILAGVCLNMVRNVFDGYPVLDVLRNARWMFYYLFFFILVASIHDRRSLVKAVNIFTVLFMVGAVSYLVTAIWKVPLASTVSDFAPGDDRQRVYHVIFQTAIVVGFVHFALLLTGVRERFAVPSWAAFITASLLVYLSYYRSYYVAYPLGLLVIAAASGRARLRALLRTSAMAIVVLGALTLMGLMGETMDRVRSLGDEVSELSGTFAVRIIIWKVRYDAISSIHPLFGTGFIWDHDPDRTVEEVILDPLVPANDNGYAAALVVLGFVGIGLFVLLYLAASWVAVSHLRGDPPALEQALSLALLGLGLYVLVNSFGLDSFCWPFAVLPNSVLLGTVNAAVLLERKRTMWGQGPRVAGSQVP